MELELNFSWRKPATEEVRLPDWRDPAIPHLRHRFGLSETRARLVAELAYGQRSHS